MYLKYCCDKCYKEFQHEEECFDHENTCDGKIVEYIDKLNKYFTETQMSDILSVFKNRLLDFELGELEFNDREYNEILELIENIKMAYEDLRIFEFDRMMKNF